MTKDQIQSEIQKLDDENDRKIKEITDNPQDNQKVNSFNSWVRKYYRPKRRDLVRKLGK